MDRTVYRSGIDWWLWLVMAASILLIILLTDERNLISSIIIGGGMILFMAASILGCRYEIDGRELIVYQFFRPTRMPIDRIRDIRKTTGYLATAGMSRRRVSINFTDYSVLKSYLPLEISPKERDAFMARLIEINPDIKEIKCQTTE